MNKLLVSINFILIMICKSSIPTTNNTDCRINSKRVSKFSSNFPHHSLVHAVVFSPVNEPLHIYLELWNHQRGLHNSHIHCSSNDTVAVLCKRTLFSPEAQENITEISSMLVEYFSVPLPYVGTVKCLNCSLFKFLQNTFSSFSLIFIPILSHSRIS